MSITTSTKTILSVLITLASLLGAVTIMASEIVWIDVRSDNEWNEGHLEGAVHIPHTEIADKIASHAADKNAEIKLYCRSGNRAGIAKTSLEEMGYTNVENLGSLADAEKTFAQKQAD